MTFLRSPRFCAEPQSASLAVSFKLLCDCSSPSTVSQCATNCGLASDPQTVAGLPVSLQTEGLPVIQNWWVYQLSKKEWSRFRNTRNKPPSSHNLHPDELGLVDRNWWKTWIQYVTLGERKGWVLESTSALWDSSVVCSWLQLRIGGSTLTPDMSVNDCWVFYKKSPFFLYLFFGILYCGREGGWSYLTVSLVLHMVFASYLA